MYTPEYNHGRYDGGDGVAIAVILCLVFFMVGAIAVAVAIGSKHTDVKKTDLYYCKVTETVEFCLKDKEQYQEYLDGKITLKIYEKPSKP